MVKDHSDSERGNPLPPHGLLFPINSKGSFICTVPQTGWHIPQPFYTSRGALAHTQPNQGKKFSLQFSKVLLQFVSVYNSGNVHDNFQQIL